jgi:secreted PhoX family phosphatase
VDDRSLPVLIGSDYSEDEGCNPSRNVHFSTVLQQASLSRRGFMQGSLSAAALGFLGLSLLDRSGNAFASTGPLIGFESVATNTFDAVTVPRGYTVDVLYSWGDAIGAPGRPPGQPAFALDASNSADEQALTKAGGGTASAMRVFSALRARPVATINDLGRRAGVSFPTAAKAVETLTGAGIVRELTGRRRDRVFVYHRYLSTLN